VQVADANGVPVAGATVTFSLGGSGGSGGAAASAGASFDGGGAQATAVTDDTGTATSPGFAANGTAGTFTAAAATVGVTQPATFALRNLSAGEPTIAVVGASHWSAAVGAHYETPLRVKVLDGRGQPLPGTTVTFSLGAGSGGASAGSAGASATFAGGTAEATAVTNARGVATSPRFTAGTVAGSFTATATAMGTSGNAVFSLHNLAARPERIAVGAAATESAPVGTAFPVRLAVTVSDGDGNPVAGVRVRFIAPAHGATGTFARRRRSVTARTDAKGVAVAPRFTAGARQGGYAVVATVGGGDAAAFALSNLPS